MEGSGNSRRDICRDGGSSRIDAERCGDADTDSARERRGGQSPARGRPRGREGGTLQGEGQGLRAVHACCLSHRTPLSSRMTTCDLHCPRQSDRHEQDKPSGSLMLKHRSQYRQAQDSLLR